MAKFAKFIKENNENFLIKKFICLFIRKLRKKGKNRFSLVLTGGKSPVKLYKSLAKIKKIPWKKIDFFISDERYVDEKSKDSNIYMCKKNLLNKIKIQEKQIYKISTDKKTIHDCVNDYEKKIEKYFLYKKISFDLVILGIGFDGHIASLFKKNINERSNKNVNFVKRKDFSRITLTKKCLNKSKTIFLWVPGKNKSVIIKKIMLDKKFKYPVSYLNGRNSFLFHCN